MKKHVLALAVAGIISAPVLAQNVSIYGQIAVTANQTSTDTSDVSSINADNFGSSILGLKGSEDLGGGMKAYFQMEANNETNDTAFGFDRHLFVGVGGAFGDVKIGRTSTALDSIKGYHSYFNIFDTAATELGGKPTGTVRYESPAFAGVSAVVTSVNNNDGTAETNDGETAFTLAGTFSGLTVQVGYGEQPAEDDSTSIINLGYNFGVAEVRAQVMNNDNSGTSSDYTSLGLSVPLGNGMTATAHWQSYDTAGTTSDYKQIGVVLSKALSKRTSVHIGARSNNVDGTASDTDLVAVGIQHSF